MPSFSNKGFKSLPLNIQKKIMKNSRKLELGGNPLTPQEQGKNVRGRADIANMLTYNPLLTGQIGRTVDPKLREQAKYLTDLTHTEGISPGFKGKTYEEMSSDYSQQLMERSMGLYGYDKTNPTTGESVRAFSKINPSAVVKANQRGDKGAQRREPGGIGWLTTTDPFGTSMQMSRALMSGNKDYPAGQPINPATGKNLPIEEFKYGGNMYPGGGTMNQYAMGAQMPQGQMTDIPTTEFNAGGSHEANSLGGIPQGVGQNGQPNLVEEGELKITIPGTEEQFIVSPKIKLDKATAEEFGLSKKHVGKDMVKIFKGLLRKNNFAEREGDSIVENSKQLEIMPYVAAHQKLTEIKNAEDTAKKQEAFDKDMGQMMEKHPEYMEALLSQSQQPMQQEGPSPEEMAMMEQQMAQMGGAPGGGMPPMARNGGMYAYGGNMYNFGSTLGAGVAGAAKGILGSIPGVGGMLEGGVDMIHGALDKDITEQDKIAMGVGETVGAAGTAAVTGGATLASGMDNMIGGATEAAANIPGMGEGGQAFLEGANQLSGLASMIPMRNGGVKMGCGGNKYGKGGKMGCNCYKCGGKMHTYGGNMFSAGGFDPLELQETFDYITALQNSQNEEGEKIMDTSLEEGVKDVTVEGGIGSSLLQVAPAVTSGIMAFSKPETYDAGDLGYKEINAPKISYSEAKKDARQQAAGVAKDIKNVGGAGYLSNRIANAQNASKIIAQISQQEETANKQLQYQNALRNQGNYQGAAAQAAMMTAQALAGKSKAVQDFGATVGSLGSKLAADQMGAGYANIYSPDINFRYNPFGKSIFGKTETNKTKKKS